MRPFENIRVLDLTHVIAGPFCTYQLAVLGADVIKIESRDEPDMVRWEGPNDADNKRGYGGMFISQNANKRAITLNLKTNAGQDVLKKLTTTADVLVENYRAGALEKLGLGAKALHAINPQLIYCSLTGYGQDGEKSGQTAYDNVIQAFSGLMSATGYGPDQPVKVGPPVLDYGTGAQAALAISAALYQRTHSGKGQRIDIAMLDAAIMLMSLNVVYNQLEGRAPTATGNSSLTHAGYGCFETSDGLLMIGAYTGAQHASLWRALGEHKTADEVNAFRGDRFMPRRESDYQKLQTILRHNTAEHWEQHLNNAKVPAARVRELHETLTHTQLSTRTVIQQVPSALHSGQQMDVPVAAFKYAEHGPRVDNPPPLLGQHTNEVLIEAGYSEEEINALRERQII